MSDKPDFSKMMEAAQKIQGQMKSAQETIEKATCTGGSPERCEVHMSGKHEIRKIKLNEKFIKEEPVEFIEEIIAHAVNEAVAKVEETMKKEMMSMTKDLGLDLDQMKQQGDDEK
jgi:DNA-binding YbaB/EbfC family protein